ncbi:hypothetical protein [Pseudomonas putida]|uniref:hypothetical protein n=1 Tax=Pseudomonas putida TaxID=303 RepID=UPI00308255B2
MKDMFGDATRPRHVRQAEIIQAAGSERCLEHRLDRRSKMTRDYYFLTVRLIVRRLRKTWVFNL